MNLYFKNISLDADWSEKQSKLEDTAPDIQREKWWPG